MRSKKNDAVNIKWNDRMGIEIKKKLILETVNAKQWRMFLRSCICLWLRAPHDHVDEQLTEVVEEAINF